ncbi:MAG: NAD(P)H-dependent oxidoreductase subunit E [Planctomycetota bacterium]
MSWQTINRNVKAFDPNAAPLLNDAVREKIRSFFPRYDTKRAVLLPALHVVQDALGHLPWQAMKEIAELLDIHPSDVMDTISFYTHFWTEPKGEKVVTVCRSISCEVMGGATVIDEVKRVLGIEEHHTTPDGKFSLATEECLAGCDYAPCLLVNEKLHKKVKVEDVAKILADPDNDKLGTPRSDLFDAPKADSAKDVASDNGHGKVADNGAIGTTSDVREMKES